MRQLTPKEKANELVLKFTCSTDVVKPNLRSKEMALLCVDEILNDNPNIYDSDRLNHKYWEEVRGYIQIIDYDY